MTLVQERITLGRNENQTRGLGQYALDCIGGKYRGPSAAVLTRVEQFHLDSVSCAVSALACHTNAPTVLREEAFAYPLKPMTSAWGACCFGSSRRLMPEKAVLANCAAVREWDANGTNFGYDPNRGNTCGEFGHNDYYPVTVAAAQQVSCGGDRLVRSMVCLDEIRGRLAEVFALHKYKIDHVLYGAIASAAVYGAIVGATAEEIESAIGLVVAHQVPFRAIRSGKQLSDTKGAAAAIAAETAVVAVGRAMRGLVGPQDILRNRAAIFCLAEPPVEPDHSPFDLSLAVEGNDYAVLGMHFKLGLYEHQAAGAIDGLIGLLGRHTKILDDIGRLQSVRIRTYEPAYSIIGDPAKRHPHTRQSADHSMVYIVATLLRKAYLCRKTSWMELMLVPEDYCQKSLFHPVTRALMNKIVFLHGGPEFDAKYPDGIPTTVEIEHTDLGLLSSGMVLYPQGHARNTSGQLEPLLEHKFRTLASLAVSDVEELRSRFTNLAEKSAMEIGQIYNFTIRSLNRG